MREESGSEVKDSHLFSQFEGCEDVSKREEGLARAQTWFNVMKGHQTTLPEAPTMKSSLETWDNWQMKLPLKILPS
ncbi:hypothetical protein JAAARDRAFT_200313 [Jaapia argillacea MUCL 33604]|uniref:Uncharacterized protein n=1 Tax=Jaapia argillacea MUCL 33604 TaxID=933084 RepID=A0A067PHX1_9AGAM|nr:hypothetical protein JAAARDRAFT_200313 [Jaapia argillacea MUCL 33604]